MAPDDFDALCTQLGLPPEPDAEAAVVAGPALARVAREAGPMFVEYLRMHPHLSRRVVRAFLPTGPRSGP